MYSIGELSSEFLLSRSTLLYYDKIGLLNPTSRSKSKYRQYSESDRGRLQKICDLREAGVSLEQIKHVVNKPDVNESSILEKRLKDINNEIKLLRLQQKVIVELLKSANPSLDKILLNKDGFTDVLTAAGIEEAAMDKLHIQFEKNSPEGHQAFLEFLGLSENEIKIIRESSR